MSQFDQFTRFKISLSSLISFGAAARQCESNKCKINGFFGICGRPANMGVYIVRQCKSNECKFNEVASAPKLYSAKSIMSRPNFWT